METKEHLLDSRLDRKLSKRGGKDEENGSDSGSGTDGRKTFWANIAVAALINLLSTIESTILLSAIWPYLRLLDKDVSSTFMGLTTSSGKAFHALFAILFGALAVRTKKIKIYLILGRIVTIIGCFLFAEAEMVSENGKYWMFASNLMFSIGDSSLMLIRGYVATASRPVDRGLAFAAIALANVLSMIIGGSSLLGFSMIGHPSLPGGGGAEILGVRLHMFNAPILLVVVLNLAVICLAHFGLTEHRPREEKSTQQHNNGTEHGWRIWRELPIFLILLCFFEKIVASTSLTTAISTTPLMGTEVFAWTEGQVMQRMAAANATIGILALITVALFMLLKVATWIPSRYIFLAAIINFFFFFFIAYPHRLISAPIRIREYMDDVGCNSDRYPWCKDTLSPSPMLYFIMLIGTFGIFFPLANISLDTVYSGILGQIDQSFFQTAIIAVDDIFQILCPTIIMHSFKLAGHPVVFTLWAGLCALGVVAWVLNGTRLRAATVTQGDTLEAEATPEKNGNYLPVENKPLVSP
ncbi:unnamed protein product, partial [Mesorhabditis spiculigera]